MGQRLRVLIAEDYENDALLYLRELNDGGYSVTFERVDTSEHFGQALDRQSWDVIIVDYSVPKIGVRVALQQVRIRGLQTPLIVVCGQFGEEWAVEAMRAGAQDCVRKDCLARLTPIVQRELAEFVTRSQRSPTKAVREIWLELDQIVTRSEQELQLLSANDRLRPGLEEIRWHARHAAETLSSLLPLH